jgi:hypothetical protein
MISASTTTIEMGRRNRLTTKIAFLFLIISLSVLFTAAGKVRLSEAEIDNVILQGSMQAGVKAGDWAKYNVSWNYWTNDTNPIIPQPPTIVGELDYFRIDVLSVTGTNITFEISVHYKNGTITPMYMWTDVAGSSMGMSFLIAANLTAGDRIYASPYSPTINATEMRIYADAEREVNCWIMTQNGAVNMTPPSGVITISPNQTLPSIRYIVNATNAMYWDRASGIMDEMLADAQFVTTSEGYMTKMSVHMKIEETNIWKPTSVAIEFKVRITPSVLNLRSKGRWITAFIGIPEGYDVHDINLSTVMLNQTIRAYSKAFFYGTLGDNGRTLLVLKFDRQALIDLILKSSNTTRKAMFEEAALTITGQFVNGTKFQGNDAIWIIWKKCRISDPDAVCRKFGTTSSRPDWDPNMDFNGDGKVNMRDIGLACNNFGKP